MINARNRFLMAARTNLLSFSTLLTAKYWPHSVKQAAETWASALVENVQQNCDFLPRLRKGVDGIREDIKPSWPTREIDLNIIVTLETPERDWHQNDHEFPLFKGFYCKYPQHFSKLKAKLELVMGKVWKYQLVWLVFCMNLSISGTPRTGKAPKLTTFTHLQTLF